MISIIVPVYNVERYLHECIDGVLKQSFQDWELLLIDDGSFDRSLEICNQFSASDKRIKVVHKHNTGVSDSRNYGLDLAQGEFIIFLDADDYWDDNTFLETFVNLAERYNLDIIRGEYKAIADNGDPLFIRDVPKQSQSYLNKVIDSSDFMDYAIHGEFFLWLSLIRTDAIKNIRFNVSRNFLEDVLFYSEMLLNPLRCMYVPENRFYAYRKHNNSASSKISFGKLADAFQMCYDFHHFVKLADDSKMKHMFMDKSIRMYYYTLDTISMDEYFCDRKMYVESLKLQQIRKDVLMWMKEYKVFHRSLIYYLSPIMGVYLFRIRHRLGCLARKILNNFKK